MRTRPDFLSGSTYRIETPVGTSFITINRDLDGLPFEAFVTVGKSGSDITAISEAMGRLISYCFKITDELPEERARGIIGQLKDIGGRRFVGFGQDKIYSLPDAIARAMAKDLGIWEEEKNE